MQIRTCPTCGGTYLTKCPTCAAGLEVASITSVTATEYTTEEQIDRAAAGLADAIAHQWEQRPHTWTQHSGAVDARGVSLAAMDPRAVSWCAIGITIRKSHEELPYISAEDRAIITERLRGTVLDLENARLRLAYTGVHQINDCTWQTAADGAAAFRRAAAHLYAGIYRSQRARRQAATA